MPRSWVSVEKRKYPGRSVGQWQAQVLAEDEFGLWLAARAGERNRHSLSGVQLLPPDRWWVAWWWDDPNGRWCAADVATPVTRVDGVFRYDDLEIDVVLHASGAVSVVDRDEFEQARGAIPYPQEIAASALSAMDELVGSMSHPIEPFAEVGPRYLQEAFGKGRAP